MRRSDVSSMCGAELDAHGMLQIRRVLLALASNTNTSEGRSCNARTCPLCTEQSSTCTVHVRVLNPAEEG
jgi:hypothetical protein